MAPPSSLEGLDRFVPGYPKLAGQMAMLPGIAIFRRFGALNARNLLYLQSELTDLEAALLHAEARDNAHPKWEKRAHAKDWYWIQHSVHVEDEDSVQYGLVMNIREKLNEYNSCMPIRYQLALVLTTPADKALYLQAGTHQLITPRSL